MNREDIHKLMGELERFAEHFEEALMNALIHVGHLSRDRMEFNAFMTGLERAPFKIATSLPRPVYRNVIKNGKVLVDQFPDDRSLVCKMSAVQQLLTYREGVMSHLIDHHRHTDISTQRVDWDALFDFYEEADDRNLKIPELKFDAPPEMKCDCCGESFDYDDVAEFMPHDDSKPIEYWCSDCMKKDNTVKKEE